MPNYHWLKLNGDFYKRHDIKIVEAMPNGVAYCWFYMKLMMESIDHVGELRFNEYIPYNDEMLASITGTDIDVVRGAMKTFIGLKMIEVLDDATIYLEIVAKLIGKESSSAERVRRYRERLKEPDEPELLGGAIGTITIDRPIGEIKHYSESGKVVAWDVLEEPEPIKSPEAPKEDHSKEVIEYLNEKTGKHFKAVDSNCRPIRARFKEGFTLEDFKSVIDKKTIEWKKDSKMNQYLRPETLFGNKFQSYLNAEAIEEAPIKGRRVEKMTDYTQNEPTKSNPEDINCMIEGYRKLGMSEEELKELRAKLESYDE